MDLYIYYRVAPEQARQLAQAAAAMQERLCRQVGVAAALKRRPPSGQDAMTFMEIYTAVPAGFLPVLERAVEEAGLATLIQGSRHVEIFEDAVPCA